MPACLLKACKFHGFSSVLIDECNDSFEFFCTTLRFTHVGKYVAEEGVEFLFPSLSCYSFLHDSVPGRLLFYYQLTIGVEERVDP